MARMLQNEGRSKKDDELRRRVAEMAALILQVKVTPRAKISELSQAADGTWIARLKSPPVDGKANEELVGLVAKTFQCRRRDVTIKAGATGRTKLVRVEA